MMPKTPGPPRFFHIKHNGTSRGLQRRVKHRHMTTMRQLSWRLVIKESEKSCGQDVEVTQATLQPNPQTQRWRKHGNRGKKECMLSLSFGKL